MQIAICTILYLSLNIWDNHLDTHLAIALQAMLTSTTIKSSMRKSTSKKTPGTPGTSAKKKQESAADTPDPRQSEVKLPETDGWLTRNETSDVLRCSLQTLKNYEARGLLHPRHARRNDRTGAERVMLVYDPKELAALPAKKPGGPREAVREPGEQAARVFELLREGRELDEIVIEMRETPERIDYLHERWLEQTKARYVITPEAKKAFEQIVGPFKDVTELVELVSKKLTPAPTT